MAQLLDNSSGMWTVLGQASNVAQLVGVDALGLVSMVVQAALAARRHRDACRRLAQHVEIVGGLLRELELAELMRREATRRPLEQLRGALRRCYALVTACQDCRGGYLGRLFWEPGWQRSSAPRSRRSTCSSASSRSSLWWTLRMIAGSR